MILRRPANLPTLIDYRPDLFYICPVSGRDAVLVKSWPVSWEYLGNRRDLVIPGDYRAGMGIDKIPGLAMRIIRGLLNPAHSWRPCFPHDALYSSQGGRRPIETCTLAVHHLPFDDASQEEADALHYVMGLRDGQAEWECALAYTVLSRAGQGAWDD